MTEKSLGVYTQSRPPCTRLPFFLILPDCIRHPLPFSASRVFPSLSPSNALSLRVSRSQRTPTAHPITLSAPFHASSRSFSFPPSPALFVRFHPRPSTFRVYRTIARAAITVTGRATSWLAVDVGGGRTADRRRRGRRRQRRRRRGRAQQTASKTRRATEKNSSPADRVIDWISRSRNVFRRSVRVLLLSTITKRKSIRTSLVRHPTYNYELKKTRN